MEPKIKQGDVVKCIDDFFKDQISNPFIAKDLNLPISGVIYTVRSVEETSYGFGIRLVGLINKEFYFSNIRDFKEPIFDISRFEKVEKSRKG